MQKNNFDILFFGYAGRLISKFRVMFGKHSFSNLFSIGLHNRLFPCGIVYVAAAGALNTNYMAIGTFLSALLLLSVKNHALADSSDQTAMEKKWQKVTSLCGYFIVGRHSKCDQ